uniref:Uncharacterized protein n=1 Tax=Onchocerca volvulus TaxID=6282 RepID=A0A8R1TW30_ONCVO
MSTKYRTVAILDSVEVEIMYSRSVHDHQKKMRKISENDYQTINDSFHMKSFNSIDSDLIIISIICPFQNLYIWF